MYCGKLFPKIALSSDFRDYYDHVFDRADSDSLLFKRFAHVAWRTISKPAQFKILEKMGFFTPQHGIVKHLDLTCDRVVIYTDRSSHQGAGKILVNSETAKKEYIDNYMSQYISFQPGRSLRILKIGKRWFSYWMRSQDDWRSNCGDSNIERKPQEIFSKDFFEDTFRSYSRLGIDGNHPIFAKFALLAIDLVPISHFRSLAIDLNTAPGLKWTGIEDILSPVKIYEEIRNFFD